MKKLLREISRESADSSEWFSNFILMEELVQESSEWAPSEYLESKKDEGKKAFSDRINIELRRLRDRVAAAKDKLFGKKLDPKKASQPVTIRVKSRNMLHSLSGKTKSDIRKLRSNSADASAVDKLVGAYKNNREKLITGAGVLVLTTPAASLLFDKARDAFTIAAASIIDDTADFMNELKSEDTADPKALKAAAAYASAYEQVSRDQLADAVEECSQYIENIIRANTEGG